MIKQSKDDRIIGEYTTRKIGNSLVLTVPASAGILERQKFLLVAKPDGSLEYRAVEKNPWLNGEYADIDFRSELKKVGYRDEKSVGKEQVEW